MGQNDIGELTLSALATPDTHAISIGQSHLKGNRKKRLIFSLKTHKYFFVACKKLCHGKSIVIIFESFTLKIGMYFVRVPVG